MSACGGGTPSIARSGGPPSLHLRRLARVGVLAVAIVAAACGSAEEQTIPDYSLQYVTAEGRVIGRHADGIDAIAGPIEFGLVEVPDQLLGFPLVLIEGIVNPPQSHVRFWYGPPETTSTPTLELARVVVSQHGAPARSRTSGGVATEVGDAPAILQGSGRNVTVHWDACGISFTLSGYDLGQADTLEAAEAVTRFCG